MSWYLQPLIFVSSKVKIRVRLFTHDYNTGELHHDPGRNPKDLLVILHSLCDVNHSTSMYSKILDGLVRVGGNEPGYSCSDYSPSTGQATICRILSKE